MKLFESEEDAPKASVPKTISAWIVKARDAWLVDRFGARSRDGYRCTEPTEDSIQKRVYDELDRRLPELILKGMGLKKAMYGDTYELDEYGALTTAVKRVAGEAVTKVIGASVEKALEVALGKSGKLPKKLEEVVLTRFEAAFLRVLETEASNFGAQAAQNFVSKVYAEHVTPLLIEEMAEKAVKPKAEVGAEAP